MAKRGERRQSLDNTITLSQAAEIAGLTQDFLRQLALRGRLEAKKLGYIWTTTPRAVRRYLSSRSLDKIPKRYRRRTN